MVISPYSTLFVSQQNSSLLRSDSNLEQQANKRANATPLNEEQEPIEPAEQIERPVDELSSVLRSDPNFGAQALYDDLTYLNLERQPRDSNPEQSTNAAPTPESPDQFDKVQTFLQIQAFEDTPNLIDTFV